MGRPKKRVVGELPPNESAAGHFDIEEVDSETDEVIEEELKPIHRSSGILVTYREPIHTFRSGHEVIRSGGTKQRLFTLKENGRDWREQAQQFIQTCQLDDGERRPKYISHEEIE